jgi:NADH dehydrogenase (ubiquinone) Fe-S protein 4
MRRGITCLGIRVLRTESTLASSTSCTQSSSISTSFTSFTSEDTKNHRVTDVLAAAGVPSLRHGRKVTIYAPPKTAMQSGSSQTLQGGAPAWRLVLEIDPKWANPLLGWTSTADAVETMTRQLQFFTKEDAIAYCTKNGIAYEVEEAVVVNKKRPKRFQGYGANFDVKRLKGGTPIGGLRSEQS